MENISLICFASSYAISLVLEITRMFFRSSIRGTIILGFAAVGLFAHTWFLGNRAFTAGESPLSSLHDWFLIAAWLLTVVYIYLWLYHPRAAIGVFVLPLVLGLVAAAHFAPQEPLVPSSASSIWGIIHGAFLLMGTVSLLVGFMAGTMYLVQSYRLKHKLPPVQGFKLPSLEWLDLINSRSIIISVLMMGLGVLSGVILNMVLHRQDSRMLPWSDPVIWSSAVLLAWVITAAVFTTLYKPARQGRKCAYLTVASFVFLTLVLGILLLAKTEHSGRKVNSNIGSGQQLRVSKNFGQTFEFSKHADRMFTGPSANGGAI